MGLDVKTGVVYGYSVYLDEESLNEVEAAGFKAYPVTYRSDEVNEEGHQYIFGIGMAQLSNVGQSSINRVTFEDLHKQYLEKAQKLSFTPSGELGVLVTSYYW